MKYTLKIFQPSSGYDVWVAFTSESPFQAISKGDIINTANFPDANTDKALQAFCVEHILSAHENRECKHIVNVYTKEIPNREEERVGD